MARTIAVAAAVLLVTGSATAHWDVGQPYKWLSDPDLTAMGIDVNATFGFILADNFECTQTGPITDIHLWGSWLWDVHDENVTFILSIHENLPDTLNPSDYDLPGQVLWTKVFPPGSYTARIYAEQITEGWLDPPEQFYYPADTVCWQYNFAVEPGEAFRQLGDPTHPVIYWLDVQAYPSSTAAVFGWKTRYNGPFRPAVWGQGAEPYPGPWSPLFYPPGHELQGPLGLAFVITGAPDVLRDWGDAPDPTYPTLAASDGANHVLVVDTFMGWAADPDADGQPHPMALGDDMDEMDDEDGVFFATPLVPGLPASVDVITTVAGFVSAWIDFGGDGAWLPASDQICSSYWVPGGTVPIPFTVPMDAALGPTFARFRFTTQMTPVSFTGPLPDGEVEDYQVTIEEGQTYKWIQEPDLEMTGIDVRDTEPFILADDYLCRYPGRVDEIHVWGSWLNDYWPFGQDPAQVEFRLSIHEDIPAWASPTGYSMPGETLWHLTIPPGMFEVTVWQTWLEEGWLDPPVEYLFPADWTCWLYTFTIPPEVAFHQVGTPDSAIVYWLDVQAHPLDSAAHFGWKTSFAHWNDDAVWGMGIEPYPGPWQELRYPSEHAWAGQSIDLAFAIKSTYGADVPDETGAPAFGLEQNAPNPFGVSTTVAYDVGTGGGRVKVQVFDLSGRLVATLVDGTEGEGRHAVTWDGRAEDGRLLPSGVYFCRLETPAGKSEQKMLLLR